MWTENETLNSKPFMLMCVSEEELRKLPVGGDELYLEREVEIDFTGDVVLCCNGETRMFGFLYKGEKQKRNGRVRNVYRVAELRRCIEFPCPELGEGVEKWHFEPQEALIEYPVHHKVDWAKAKRLGAWRVFWLKCALYGVFGLIAITAGVLMWLLAKYSPVVCGLLFAVFVFLVWYKAAKLSL